MNLLICPWCSSEISSLKGFGTSDPTFVFFQHCSTCSIRARGRERGYYYKVDQKDVLCGFVLQLRISPTGYLELDSCGNYYVISSICNGIETIATVEKTIEPSEAKDILLKYKGLRVFL